LRELSLSTRIYLFVGIILIATNFNSQLHAETKTPNIRSSECKKLFSDYQHMPTYKAFALSADGRHCGWSKGYVTKTEAINTAMGWCEKSKGKECRIIANSNTPPAGYNEKPDGAGLLIQIPADADISHIGDYAKQYSEATRRRTNQIPKFHRGIDLVRKNGPNEGLQIIAAAAGEVTRAVINECAGGEVVVRSEFKRDGKNIHVEYVHLGRLLVRKGQRIKRGQPVGELSRGKKHWPCMGSRAHLHFSVRLLPANGSYQGHLNPNEFWSEGRGKLTCFDEAATYHNRSLNLTSPIRCEAVSRPEQKAFGAAKWLYLLFCY